MALVLVPAILFAQDITAFITQMGGGKPALAVIDFRGSGSQQFMAPFNSTLFSDLDGSGLFDMKPKSVFPLNNPQRPEDLRPSDGGQGLALADWSWELRIIEVQREKPPGSYPAAEGIKPRLVQGLME